MFVIVSWPIAALYLYAAYWYITIPLTWLVCSLIWAGRLWLWAIEPQRKGYTQGIVIAASLIWVLAVNVPGAGACLMFGGFVAGALFALWQVCRAARQLVRQDFTMPLVIIGVIVAGLALGPYLPATPSAQPTVTAHQPATSADPWAAFNPQPPTPKLAPGELFFPPKPATGPWNDYAAPVGTNVPPVPVVPRYFDGDDVSGPWPATEPQPASARADRMLRRFHDAQGVDYP